MVFCEWVIETGTERDRTVTTEFWLLAVLVPIISLGRRILAHWDWRCGRSHRCNPWAPIRNGNFLLVCGWRVLTLWGWLKCHLLRIELTEMSLRTWSRSSRWRKRVLLSPAWLCQTPVFLRPLQRSTVLLLMVLTSDSSVRSSNFGWNFWSISGV